MIGARIKRYREMKDMSQQDLSSAASISLGLVQQIEQGRHSNPSIKVMEKIAYALDVDVIHLLKDPVDTKLPSNTIEELKKRVRLIYVPLFKEIPSEEDIHLKRLSKVLALVPIVNNRADYVIQVPKEFKLCGSIRSNDYIAIRKTKLIKDNSIYIFQTKDRKYHTGLCKIYNGNKAYFRSQDVNEEPIEYNKNSINVIGEVVIWLKSSLNDSLPLHKINL